MSFLTPAAFSLPSQCSPVEQTGRDCKNQVSTLKTVQMGSCDHYTILHNCHMTIMVYYSTGGGRYLCSFLLRATFLTTSIALQVQDERVSVKLLAHGISHTVNPLTSSGQSCAVLGHHERPTQPAFCLFGRQQPHNTHFIATQHMAQHPRWYSRCWDWTLASA